MADQPNAKPKPAYEPPGPIFLGVGSPQPKSRQLTGGMFGHLPDAFDSKTLDIGGETPFQKRERAKAEAEKARKEAEESKANQNGKDDPDAEPVPDTEEEVAAPMPVSEAVSMTVVVGGGGVYI